MVNYLVHYYNFYCLWTGVFILEPPPPPRERVNIRRRYIGKMIRGSENLEKSDEKLKGKNKYKRAKLKEKRNMRRKYLRIA
jgi:hypothetical protein